MSSSSTAPLFEAIDDVFDFAPPPPARPPRVEDEEMDFDLDAEIAMMQEEEERAGRRVYDDSPPPNVEEEPDWDEDMDSAMESTAIETESVSATTTTAGQRSTKTTASAVPASAGEFGESDIFNFPIASCKRVLPLVLTVASRTPYDLIQETLPPLAPALPCNLPPLSAETASGSIIQFKRRSKPRALDPMVSRPKRQS